MPAGAATTRVDVDRKFSQSRLKGGPPMHRQAEPIAPAVVGDGDGRLGQLVSNKAATGDAGLIRPPGGLPEQGRAAGSAEPAALRTGTGDVVDLELAVASHHLAVGDIDRPAEGAARPALAVGAVADGVEDELALDLDAAGVAAANGFGCHRGLPDRRLRGPDLSPRTRAVPR